MTGNRLRQGHHGNWVGDAKPLGFCYELRPTNENYVRVLKTQWLETMPLDQNFWNEADPRPTPLWWIIELHGQEIVQSAVDFPTCDPFGFPYKKWMGTGPAPVPPQFANRFTHLKARIHYQNNSGRSRWVDVDIGPGIRVAVIADQVNVDLLGPPNSAQVVEGSNVGQLITVQNPDQDDVAIAQALITGTVSLSPFAPTGERVATNTIVVDRAEDDSALVKIPPGASQVQVYLTEADAVSDLDFVPGVRRLAGDLFDVMPRIANLPIIAANLASPRLDIPKHADHIFIPALAEDNRYSFVFELEF